MRWHGEPRTASRAAARSGCAPRDHRRIAARFVAFACIAIAVLFTACDGPTLPPRASSDVYDFRLQGDTLHVFHWPLGSEVRVYVVPDPNAALTTMLTSAVDRGAAQWNAYALFGEYHIVRTTSLLDADAVIRFSTDPSPVSTEFCEPALSVAVTTFCLEDPDATPLHLATFHPLPPGDTTAGNVKMLVSVLTTQASIDGRVDMLVVHELGHVLGIGQHSPEATDLMAAGVPVRNTPNRRDIATVQVLYHTSPDILP